MRLPRNRWFGPEQFTGGVKTVFKFGKYNGEALQDVASKRNGLWYLEDVVLNFDDLDPPVKAFVEEAIRIKGDPLTGGAGPAPTPPPAPTREDRSTQRLALLKQEAKNKIARMKKEKEAQALLADVEKANKQKEKEAKKTQAVLQKRKEESEW